MMTTNLKEQLQNWEGIHTEYLIHIYQNNKNTTDFFEEIIDLYNSEIELQKGTTWLVKHHYDSKNKLTKKQVANILLNVNNLEHWESKLHILQLIPHFEIETETIEKIEPFVRTSLKATKKFVKAAAYQAYFEIVKKIPALQNEFKMMCETAMLNESASIKSKVRKIIVKLK